ncbi:MAG: threonine synthase [Daejeonella sp.]
MEFYSTNNKNLRISFQEAVFNSLPADNGLYMPLVIPKLRTEFVDSIEEYSFREIAFEIASTFLADEIPAIELKLIIDEVISFPAPLVKLEEDIFILELFHGPSMAFKDFGARFMSRIMSRYLKKEDKKLNVLVATSGDTGGAVALGFKGVENTAVTILFPKGKVSPVQELQLTGNGQNIIAIEIDGTFDDCQALVKQAFLDPELNEKFRLTSANSINIARLIPQIFYYFQAFAELKKLGKNDLVFSVPSGNFGNLAAGLFAQKMGLPVKQFIAATNVNDTVPVYLSGGKFLPKPSVQTYSNAMDVGNPSNWVRIMDLFNGDFEKLKKKLSAFSFTDEQTLKAINDVFQKDNYIVCPHTAIAWLAAKNFQKDNPGTHNTIVCLSTAHPCKFPEVFPEEIRQSIDEPDQLKTLNSNDQSKISMDNEFKTLKNYLLSRSN